MEHHGEPQNRSLWLEGCGGGSGAQRKLVVQLFFQLGNVKELDIWGNVLFLLSYLEKTQIVILHFRFCTDKSDYIK